MGEIRKQRGSKTKAKIALEAVQDKDPLSVIGKRHGVHPTQVGKWRKSLLDRAHEIFVDNNQKTTEFDEEIIKELYEKIGRLEVENDFLKKKSGL